MIRDLDQTIQQLISEELNHFGLNHPADYAIAFDPPTKKWSESPGADRVVNLYLYDIRENRDLRDNQPEIHRNPDGTVTSTQPPVRLDLHYLVTAWSLATTDKVLEEHRLLSQVAWAIGWWLGLEDVYRPGRCHEFPQRDWSIPTSGRRCHDLRCI